MKTIQFKNNEAPYLYATVNLNLMQDNIEDAIQKSEVYSKEEQVIGTWVDGKPLYRKVMVFNDAIDSEWENKFAHNIENAKFVRIKEAHIYDSTTGYSLPLPITLYGSNTVFDHLNVRVDRTHVWFLVNTAWGTGWYKVVVLEYTKTTD